MAGGPIGRRKRGAMGGSSTGGADDVLTAQWAPILVPGGGEARARGLRLCGMASTLTSERDQTFLGRGARRRCAPSSGSPTWRSAEAVIAFELGALRHLAAQAPGLPVPQVVPWLDGSDGAVPFADGTRRIASLLTYLDGRPLHARAQLGPGPRHRRGAGRDRPRPRRLCRRAARDQAALGHHPHARPAPPGRPCRSRTLARRGPACLDAFEREILPGHGALPRQEIHNDFNPQHPVDAADPDRVTGIIDFGDMEQGAARQRPPPWRSPITSAGPTGSRRLQSPLRGYAGAIRLSDVEADIRSA